MKGTNPTRYFTLSTAVSRLVFWLVMPVLVSGFVSCGNNTADQDLGVAARVYDNYLYKSDVQAAIPRGLSAPDSLAFARRFVEDWVSRQVFIRYAGRNLTNEEMNFERELENYKNSLIIHRFESKLIASELDTIVTEQQLLEYYEQHQLDFRLTNNIVRAKFVILPNDAPDLATFRRLFGSTDAEDLIALGDYCVNHAVSHFLETDTWLIFEELMRVVPLRVEDPAAFLAGNNTVEVTDNTNRYFIHFVDYQLRGSPSPFSFSRNKIRDLLLTRRKAELLVSKRNQLYQEAMTNRRVEIFHNSN